MLPSYDTLKKKMVIYQKKTIEGKFYFDEMCHHIQTNGYLKKVAKVEDGTKLVEHIEYGADTNSIIDLVLPLDLNGMPKCCCYPAETAKQICDAIKSSAKSLYVHTSCFSKTQLCRWLFDFFFSIFLFLTYFYAYRECLFLLGFYGTDNKFTSDSVIARSKYLLNEIWTKRGVWIICFGADPRIIKAQNISWSLETRLAGSM